MLAARTLRRSLPKRYPPVVRLVERVTRTEFATAAVEPDVNMVTLTVNGVNMTVPTHFTILDACRQAHINVPTLCNHPRLPAVGKCRICAVEVEGKDKLQVSCVTHVEDGMTIHTNSKACIDNTRSNLTMVLARHPMVCMECPANGNCELQDLVYRYGGSGGSLEEMATQMRQLRGKKNWHHEWDDKSSAAVIRAMDKCIECGRCVRACGMMQGMNVLGFASRGEDTLPRTVYDMPLDFTQCIECGQCAWFCPTGAIAERPEISQVLDKLENKAEHKKVLVASTAPSVRVAMGEEIGAEPGAVTTGQMVSALRELGFDYVFDTNFTADLTIMEEGTELIQRVKAGGPFPMFTSCCPGWVTMVEKSFPEFLPNLSTCRSPQAMMSSLLKHYWAAKEGIQPEDVITVSVMPCTAKKAEAERSQLRLPGHEDISETDHVITTRELGRMIRLKKVPLASLPESEFDTPLGLSTGASVMFGATGGTLEAALRTAHEILTHKPLPQLEVQALRGLKGVKETTVHMDIPRPGDSSVTDELNLNVAVVSGGGNIRHFMEDLRARLARGEMPYHFIEMMACPGGCIGGGGQPKSQDPLILQKRMQSVFSLDERSRLRKSHENPAVQELYRDFLGEPCGHKSHELLHTTYTPRNLQCLHLNHNEHMDPTAPDMSYDK